MALALITGANRGLGLEFTRQYLQDGWRVIGCCRDPDGAHELASAGAEVMKLDVTQAADVSAASKRLAGTSIDLLVCNAGVSGARAPVLSPVTQADFDQVMHTNVLGPMRIGAALADHVRPGGKIAYLSRRMGSIGAMKNAVRISVIHSAINAAVPAMPVAISSHGRRRRERAAALV